MKLLIIILLVIIACNTCTDADADSVYCNVQGLAITSMRYTDVQDLQPAASPITYQFKYAGKRYIVSVNNCIMEFDK